MIPLGVLAGSRHAPAVGGAALIQHAAAGTSGAASTSLTLPFAATPGAITIIGLAHRYQITSPPVIDGFTLVDWINGTDTDSASVPGLAILAGPSAGTQLTATWGSGSNAAMIAVEYSGTQHGDSDVIQLPSGENSTLTLPDAHRLLAFHASRETSATAPQELAAIITGGSLNVRVRLAAQDVDGDTATWSHGSIAHTHAAIELI